MGVQLVGHQVKRQASTESERYKITTRTNTYCNHNVEHIDMESSSTNFNNSFYEVKPPFIHLLCCCSQSLVSVWAVLYRPRGHLLPGRPSVSTTLRPNRLHTQIRIT